MTWVRIDDGFYQHPKVAAAGPLAMAMQVAALCYCNRHLTDGFVPRAVVPTLLNLEGIATGLRDHEHFVTGDTATWQDVVRDLIRPGMWEETDGGYRIHDYLDWNLSKAEVLKLREARSEAGRKGGQASARASAQADAKQTPQQGLKQNRSKLQPPSPSPSPSPSRAPGSPSEPSAPQGPQSADSSTTRTSIEGTESGDQSAGGAGGGDNGRGRKRRETWATPYLDDYRGLLAKAHGVVVEDADLSKEDIAAFCRWLSLPGGSKRSPPEVYDLLKTWIGSADDFTAKRGFRLRDFVAGIVGVKVKAAETRTTGGFGEGF